VRALAAPGVRLERALSLHDRGPLYGTDNCRENLILANARGKRQTGKRGQK
jgi:hypothetical protein